MQKKEEAQTAATVKGQGAELKAQQPNGSTPRFCPGCGAMLAGYPCGDPTHMACPVALWGRDLHEVLAGRDDMGGCFIGLIGGAEGMVA